MKRRFRYCQSLRNLVQYLVCRLASIRLPVEFILSLSKGSEPILRQAQDTAQPALSQKLNDLNESFTTGHFWQNRLIASPEAARR
jgi:hypothetical protein